VDDTKPPTTEKCSGSLRVTNLMAFTMTETMSTVTTKATVYLAASIHRNAAGFLPSSPPPTAAGFLPTPAAAIPATKLQ
jgi:hypothetical protein